MIAEVEDFVCERTVKCRENAGDNIVNVGVVTLRGAVTEARNGEAVHDVPSKQEGGHIRAAGRSVDGEEPQADAGEAIEVVIGVGEEFAGFFGSGVRAYGAVKLHVFAEGCGWQLTVDGGGGGVDKRFDVGFDSQFEEMKGTEDIGLLVQEGLGDAGADARAGGKVANFLACFAMEDLLELIVVADVGLVDAKAREVVTQGSDVVVFHAR